MPEPDLRLQKPLEDYVEYFEKLTLRSVPLIDNLSDISMAFVDSAHNVRGRDAAQKILRWRLETHDLLRYEILDFCWGRRSATAYVRWCVAFEKKAGILRKKDQIRIDGMLEIGFSPQGKVCSHIEFWSSPFPLENYSP